MTTIKLSYSILSNWAMGRQEDAVASYLGKQIPATPAMELGKAYDTLWSAHILKTKELPSELGGGSLNSPIVQQKLAKLIPFSEQYQIYLVGVPDLIDISTDGGATIVDFKCGRTQANAYIDKFQLDYYKLLVPDATLGVYRCYNPYLKELTVGVKFLNDHNAENALNHILTYGGEMIDYLASQRLIKDFKETT